MIILATGDPAVLTKRVVDQARIALNTQKCRVISVQRLSEVGPVHVECDECTITLAFAKGLIEVSVDSTRDTAKLIALRFAERLSDLCGWELGSRKVVIETDESPESACKQLLKNLKATCKVLKYKVKPVEKVSARKFRIPFIIGSIYLTVFWSEIVVDAESNRTDCLQLLERRLKELALELCNYYPDWSIKIDD